MKKLIYLLLAMPLLFTSCSKDEGMASEETVQVSFSTELPKRIGTRAGTTDLNVNKVVCAVFEDGEEISSLREVITIQEGEDIVFAPRLIKGRTYDVVFWAMKDNIVCTTFNQARSKYNVFPLLNCNNFTQGADFFSVFKYSTHHLVHIQISRACTCADSFRKFCAETYLNGFFTDHFFVFTARGEEQWHCQ